MATRDYTNSLKTLTVHWDSDKCEKCHSCVKGLPAVFDPDRPQREHRPWVDMEGASVEQIEEQVKQCPSGALTIKEK